MQSALRLAGVQVKFDMFDALKNLAVLHDDIEVSVRVHQEGIAVRLYAGIGRTERVFSIQTLRDSNIDVLKLEFDSMIRDLKEVM